MEPTRWTKEEMRQALLSQLSHGALRRKKLLESTLKSLGMSPEEIADTRLDSDSLQQKIALGALLTEMIHDEQLTEDGLGYIVPNEEGSVWFDADEVRQYITEQVTKSAPIGKRQLFLLAEQHFGTDKTASARDDNALHSAIGRILTELEREGHIRKTQRGYLPVGLDAYPATELGGWLRKAAGGGNLKQCFLEAVHTKGGEWFEYFCVRLLTAYYVGVGKTVSESSVTGGSNDGGIDGIIRTTDDLGYRETILMQMKNRHAVMTPKDIREFYGAVCAEHGSRGIFITLSSFHIEAQRFMDRIDNLTGIDGNRLFLIAEQYNMGLKKKDGKTVIDDDFFLES